MCVRACAPGFLLGKVHVRLENALVLALGTGVAAVPVANRAAVAEPPPVQQEIRRVAFLSVRAPPCQTHLPLGCTLAPGLHTYPWVATASQG